MVRLPSTRLLTSAARPRPRPRRQFTSSASTPKPINSFQFSQSSSQEPSTSTTSNGTRETTNLLEDVISKMGELHLHKEDTSSEALFRTLPLHSTHSPRSLSPHSLLTPYPAKPVLSSAHPLGVPVSLYRLTDKFVRLGISPLDAPMNPYFGGEFCTGMGKIMSRGKTGLGRKNQRRVGKAVRRGRSMGILPTFGQSVPSNGGGGMY